MRKLKLGEIIQNTVFLKVYLKQSFSQKKWSNGLHMSVILRPQHRRKGMDGNKSFWVTLTGYCNAFEHFNHFIREFCLWEYFNTFILEVL